MSLQSNVRRVMEFRFWGVLKFKNQDFGPKIDIGNCCILCQKCTFEVLFLCQKPTECFSVLFSFKNINIGEFFQLQFLDILLLKLCPFIVDSALGIFKNTKIS